MIIINILNILQLCQDSLFLLRTKTLVAMLLRLLLSLLSMVLEIMLNELLHMVVLSLLIRLKRKMISLNCHVNLNYLNLLNLLIMNKHNIWKIIIGAISAALGYILSAIGI
nr:MAG TPA: hypothetical protein [Microviridae sp.]